jgi:hypothetical protein
MKTNYTETEDQRLTEANTKAAFDYLEALIDHPEKIAEVPDGAIVVVPTEDEWVNEQNQAIAAKWSKEENRPIAHAHNHPVR